MYDLNFARTLCARIASEDDPEKLQDMLKLLVVIEIEVGTRNEAAFDTATLRIKVSGKNAEVVYTATGSA